MFLNDLNTFTSSKQNLNNLIQNQYEGIYGTNPGISNIREYFFIIKNMFYKINTTAISTELQSETYYYPAMNVLYPCFHHTSNFFIDIKEFYIKLKLKNFNIEEFKKEYDRIKERSSCNTPELIKDINERIYPVGRLDSAHYGCNQKVFSQASSRKLPINSLQRISFAIDDNLSVDQSQRQKVCYSVLPSRGEGSLSSNRLPCKLSKRSHQLGIKICDPSMAGSDCISSI